MLQFTREEINFLKIYKSLLGIGVMIAHRILIPIA